MLGVAVIAIGAWAAHEDVHRWYEARPVQTTREATGRVLESQVVLGTVVAVRPSVRDTRDRPTRTNPARGSAQIQYQPIIFRINSGQYRNRLAVAQNIVQFKPSANVVAKPGTQVRLHVAGQHGEVAEVLVQRPAVRYSMFLTWLAVLLGMVIVLLRRRGLAFVAMVIGTGLATMYILAPAIASGMSPTVVVAVYALLLMAGFVALSGEVNRKAFAAILGGLSGLIVAAVAAKIGSGLLKLTGYSSTYALMLGSVLPNRARLDMVSLIQCGTVMCILGIVLDVGISVASGVEQVLVNNPDVPRREAMRAGLRMSRDITGMMLLTLIFVCIGESLPILLLARTATITALELGNSEALSVEVVRIVSAGLGMLVAGPAAAAVAALATRRTRDQTALRAPRPIMWWAVCTLELTVCVFGLIWILGGPARAQPPAEPDRMGCPSDVPRLLSADGYHRLARDQLHHGCENATVLALWHALELDPNHGPSRVDLAHLYTLRRWFTLAHAEAKRAVELMPNDTKAHYVLGITAAWVGTYETSERHLREALRLDPTNAAAAEALHQMFPDIDR